MVICVAEMELLPRNTPESVHELTSAIPRPLLTSHQAVMAELESLLTPPYNEDAATDSGTQRVLHADPDLRR